MKFTGQSDVLKVAKLRKKQTTLQKPPAGTPCSRPGLFFLSAPSPGPYATSFREKLQQLQRSLLACSLSTMPKSFYHTHPKKPSIP